MSQTVARHPKGLAVLFATEMWERFSFYTMLSMLVLYFINQDQGFGWSKEKATTVYSNYMMFVYASPLIGGWLADKVTGFRKAITIGGLFFVVGHVLMAFPSVSVMYVALTCLVIGNGFFKPNISAIVGSLYPNGSSLKDNAFNIFYMGINVGALLAPIVAETMMQRFGFHWAFATAGFGMVIAMAVFWGFKNIVERDREAAKNAAAMAEQKSREDRLNNIPDSQRILALMVIFAIVIVFWMIFHQQFSTLVYWANENTDWTQSRPILWGAWLVTLGTVKPDVGNISGILSNVINPFFVIAFTFPLIAFWRWLNKKGREPSTPTKMMIGMVLTALSYYVMYFSALSGGNVGKVSPYWLVATYAIITTGELCLSPMGLSLVSKVAPERLRGFMMGFWFLAIAIGNKLTMIGVYWDVWSHSQFFFILASMALAMTFLLLVLLKPLKRAMPGV